MPETVNLVYDPGGNGFRIERLWAFLSIHGDGDEGLIGMNGLPMIAADEKRLDALRVRVQEMVSAPTAGAPMKPVMLVRFDRRTDFDLIVP